MPTSNSQKKSAPDTHIHHQQVGAEQRGVDSIAQGKDWPKGPERNQREILWDSNLNCGIAREREKINWSEYTASRSQKKRTEKLQRSASLRWTGPSPSEAGGRGEGKGANSAPEMASPTTLQTGLQFLSKDFLRFWMVDILREGCG